MKNESVERETPIPERPHIREVLKPVAPRQPVELVDTKLNAVDRDRDIVDPAAGLELLFDRDVLPENAFDLGDLLRRLRPKSFV